MSKLFEIGDTVKVRDEYSNGLTYKTGVVKELYQGMVKVDLGHSATLTVSEKLLEVLNSG
jgi:hypothetical protein